MGKGYFRQVFAVTRFITPLMLTASLQAGSYQVGVAPPTVKVMIQGAAQGWPFEGTIANHYDLYLARGEHEAMQVVVIAADALTNASVAVSVPQEAHGAGPLNGEANAWLVGHVDVFDSIWYGIDFPLYLVDYHGWYPDPLLTFTNTCSSINPGDRVAFWIDVSTLRAATAGDYVATITVTAHNSPSTNVQLNIHVWDFELPLKTSLPTVFSLNETLTGDAGGPKNLYGSDWVAKGIAQKFYDLLLARRMGVTHLYGMPDDASVESFASIVDWAARGASAVNLKNLGKSNPANLSKVTDSALRDLVNQVRGAGLLGMSCVYGYDECGSSYFTAIHDMFNQVHVSYPGLRTMTTAKDSTFGLSTGLRSVVDIWVPQTDVYSQAAANQLRAEGKDMWWYICSGPWRPYINFFVEYPAIEPRLLMGLMAYKCQTGGFLYYSIAKWLFASWHGPITSGPYTNWDPRSGDHNNGDGSLFCAGADGPLPTIRSENIRDGLEDYEYLKLLGDLVRTMSAVSQPTPQQLAWISSAQQLLAVPATLIASVTSYTRNTAALESYREQLAAAILTGNVLSAYGKQLTIAPASTGNVRLLWPTNPAGFSLEASTNLGATTWSNILPAPVVIGTNNVVTNAMDTPRKFYRLRR